MYPTELVINQHDTEADVEGKFFAGNVSLCLLFLIATRNLLLGTDLGCYSAHTAPPPPAPLPPFPPVPSRDDLHLSPPPYHPLPSLPPSPLASSSPGHPSL